MAVRLAEKLAVDFRLVDDAFKAELREHFSNAEVVELSVMIGQYMAMGRMLVMFGPPTDFCEIYKMGE